MLKHSHSFTPVPRTGPVQVFSHSQLFTLTAGLIGLQFCWAIQIGYVTMTLLELGLSKRFVSYAWLAGPIAGIVVQPIVGVLSDRCTSRFGRRRPFLVAGTVLSVLNLILFAYSARIGSVLGDPVSDGNVIVTKPRAIAIAIIAFWALDFAINAAQGPLRTLLADVVPPSQQKVGNSYFAFATGLGNFSGNVLGSLHLSSFLPMFADDLQALYTIGAIVLLTTMAITVFSTHEVPIDISPATVSHRTPSYDALDEPMPHTPAASEAGPPTVSLRPRVSFLEAARTAPHPFWSLFIVQCFSWIGWFTLFVFGTSWVGAEVYNGSYTGAEGTPQRELYDTGVRVGNLALALQSLMTILVSPALPAAISRTSAQTIYVAASVCLGGALSSSLLLTHNWQAGLAVAAIASTGFAWAVTMTVPWALMGEAVARFAPERAGMYFTMFNLSQCFPEVVVSLGAEEVMRITDRQATVLALGGMAVFVAAGLIVAMRIGKADEVRPDEMELTERLPGREER